MYSPLGLVISLLVGVVIGQLGTWRWIRKRYKVPRIYAVHQWLDEVVENSIIIER